MNIKAKWNELKNSDKFSYIIKKKILRTTLPFSIILAFLLSFVNANYSMNINPIYLVWYFLYFFLFLAILDTIIGHREWSKKQSFLNKPNNKVNNIIPYNRNNNRKKKRR